MNIVRYNTLDDLLISLYQTDVEDLRRSEHGGCDIEGNELTFTYDEMCDNIKVCGCYGYADPKKQEIHLWIDDKNPPEYAGLLALLSHEIAHNTGIPLDDDLEEERRAEEISYITVKAYEMCEELLNKKRSV